MCRLVERATFFVAALVQGREHLGGKLAAFFQHGVDGVGIHLCVRRQGLQLGDDIEHLVHQELHVTQGRGVLGHGKSWGEGDEGAEAVCQRRPARDFGALT